VPRTAVMVVWSSADDCVGPDFALLELTPEYAQLLLRRMAMARAQQSQDKSLYALSFWSGQPTFVCWDALPEELAGQVEEEELVILEQAPAVAADQVERVECVRAVVTPEDVYWEAIVKHTSIRLATATCPRATLAEIVQQTVCGTPGG